MLTTSAEKIAERLKRLRFYGMQGEYYAEEEVYNSGIDEIHAALLDFRLQWLEEEVGLRKRIAKLYSEGLEGVGDIAMSGNRPDRDHRYYLYTIRTCFRDKLRNYLTKCGIETRINYPFPIHLMRGYSFLGYAKGSLPVTEQLAGEILSLPMYGALPLEHVDRVIVAIKSFFSAR